MYKIGILLSGCGVYDGSEIQEAVLTMLAIDEIGASYCCISIDAPQHHVVNHQNGQETIETRNMLVESARIARGDIQPIQSISPADIDALVIPGGFGSAKNFTNWAFQGPDGTILPEVKLLLVNLFNVGKPIVSLCVSSIVLAKALEDAQLSINLTIGSTAERSPYDIQSFNSGLASLGAQVDMKTIREVAIDKTHRIISAPCYMMDATIGEVNTNIRMAISALQEMLQA